jgi:hypothetical protein
MNSEGDRPSTDSVQRHGFNVFIATTRWIQLLQGKTKILTFAQIDEFHEVYIFRHQITEIQQTFRYQPHKLTQFHDLLHCGIFEATVSRERFLDTYQEWTTLHLFASSTPNAKWLLPELWQTLSMESRTFFTMIRATRRANGLLTDDPVEREFGKLVGLPPPCFEFPNS